MTSYEDIRNSVLESLSTKAPEDDDFTNAMKNLKLLEEAFKINQDVTVKEEKNFFQEHASDFIRVGGTIATVVVIGIIETKFDVIFRSKASKHL
jgi:hypothetical protein